MSENLGSGSRALVRALLGGRAPAATESARRRQLVDELGTPTAEQCWLILAVLGRRLPTSAEVERATRIARHDGLRAVLHGIAMARLTPSHWFDPPVDVLVGTVLVDVHDSATTRLMTGVQRLARGIADNWLPLGATLVGWSPSRTQLRAIDPAAWNGHRRGGALKGRGIVPWKGHYVLAEVVTDTERTLRVHALAAHAASRTMLVGADVIPLTTAETTGPRMPGVFAKYLAAASRMSVVAAISNTAAAEYSGWRDMLPSAGIDGPEVVAVELAASAEEPPAELRAEAEAMLLSSDASGVLPLVLSVGSHEPRKNHGAVLQAAELLWREGAEFSLVFVGGNAWHSEEFRMCLAELQDAGRRVKSLSGVSDGILWWGYRLARVTMFPSVNEGFGLPVVESLASGTPVITSNFGSLAEIAGQGGGCILVDPHDDSAVAAGLRAALTDDAMLDRLAAEARSRSTRSWSTYADELWRVLMLQSPMS